MVQVTNGKNNKRPTVAPPAAPAITKVDTAQDAKAQAASVGNYLASNEFAVVNTLIEHLLEIKEEEKVGPLTLMLKMEDSGVDFSKFARVGTSYKDQNTNYIPETIQVWNPERSKYEDANWFTIAWAASPLGVKYRAILDDIKLAKDPKTTGEAKLYKDMATDAAYLKDEERLYNGRMQAGKNLFRNAVHISNQLDNLAERDSVEIKFNTETDPKTGKERMKRTKYPFKLCDANDLSKFMPLAISDFLKVKTVDKEGNAIDTFKGLADTLKKAPKTGAETGKAQVKIILKSAEEANNYCLALLNYFDPESEHGTTHKAALMAEMAKPSGEATLKQWGDLCIALDAMWTVIQPDYTRLSERTIGNRAKFIDAAKERGNVAS